MAARRGHLPRLEVSEAWYKPAFNGVSLPVEAFGAQEVPEAEKFIKEYCGDEFNDALLFHHLAYTAILSYYWYVWALYREACGAVMGDSLYNWHVMAKRYANYLVDRM